MLDNRIKEVREVKGLTQLQVANVLHISRSTYSTWECGIDNFSTSKMYSLANYYHESIDYLLKLSDIDKVIDCDKDISLKIIGERLLKIRKDNKLSQRAIAHSININHSTWGAYERGQTLITLISLYSLAKIYNVSIDFILGRS